MSEKLPQKLEIGVTEVRRNLGKLLNQIHRGDEHVVVKKLSTPIAAIKADVDYFVSEDKDFTARDETTARL